ncbi:hypothetical protein FZEAL_7087 [Fusarium zealandicum]|uniref:Uncharacterized protein n=1 Tax=Fusarium zealandicum TaxID=1053134 RepID=A0A8H4XIZ6_9HYPO|nr:hypothetical protein FZEAL_7087 [Fusarium zealandicum]
MPEARSMADGLENSTLSEPGKEPPKSMTGVEIGIIVATVVCFVLFVSAVFYCRHAEQRRRVKGILRQAEEGNAENEEKDQPLQNNDEQGQVRGQKRESAAMIKEDAHLLTITVADPAQGEKADQVPEILPDNDAGRGNEAISMTLIQEPETSSAIRGGRG